MVKSFRYSSLYNYMKWISYHEIILNLHIFNDFWYESLKPSTIFDFKPQAMHISWSSTRLECLMYPIYFCWSPKSTLMQYDSFKIIECSMYWGSKVDNKWNERVCTWYRNFAYIHLLIIVGKGSVRWSQKLECITYVV